MRIVGILMMVTLLPGAAAPAAAQQGRGRILGTVMSGAAQPLPGARVVISRPGGSDTTLLTDVRGQFALERAGPGRYVIQAHWSGNASARNVFDLERNERYEVEFTVGDPAPRPDLSAPVMPELTAETKRPAAPDRRVFESRMATGMGQYLTQDEIDARDGGTLVDLLRRVRGVRISCSGGPGCVARMARAPGGCTPLYFIDDLESDARSTLALLNTDIRGVEVYAGLSQIPGELVTDHARARCGAIAVWTRRGPDTPPPGPDPSF